MSPRRSLAIPGFVMKLLVALALVFNIANGQTTWITSQRVGDEVRFLFGSHIQRYDLTSKSWLSTLFLPRSGATAMATDGEGAVVAYGPSIYRYNPDFATDVPIGNTSSSIQSLFLDGNLIIAVHSSGLYARITIFDRATGTQLSTVQTYVRSMYGTSHAPNSNRLYGRTQGISPSDIVTTSYTDAGVVAAVNDSPYHGAYPSAINTWVFPDETRVLDSSGVIYAAPALTFSGSFAGSVTDIAFNGDAPIVLRNGEIIAFSPNLVEVGRAPITATSNSELYVTTSEAFIFSPGSATPSVQSMALSLLTPPEAGEAVDPNGLPYTIDDAFVDKDGNLLLFSKAQSSLFRWSPIERRYTGSFPLVGPPEFAAYSSENHTAYFAYASQVVRAMELNAADPVEVPLFALPQLPTGLATAGGFITTSDPSGAWHTHYVFSPDGQVIDSADWNYRSRVWTWDPVKRRMYFFRDSVSPNDLHYEEIDTTGRFSGSGETPYHGSFAIAPPIRVSQDGEKVIIGSGVVFETDSMTQLGALPVAFSDAVWRTDEIVTIRASGNQTLIQSWNGTTLAPISSLPLVPGTPVRILAIDSECFAVVTTERGIPRIQLFNENLEATFTFISSPTAVEDTPYTWTPSFDWSALGAGPITVNAQVLPVWLGFSNGVLSGTPLEADSGSQENRSESHRVVLRATNSLNQSEEREFYITAEWRNDAPVFADNPPPVIANDEAEDSLVDLRSILLDPDELDVHQWRITANTNSNIISSIRIGEDGMLEISYSPYVSGQSTITLEVTDASGASATTDLEIVLPELPSPEIVIDTAPVLSRLSGLYEQKVTVTNIAARAIGGFDLFITGLRTGVNLYNGSSTAASSGTIAYHQPVQAGESVSLVLEYFASPRGTVPSPDITTELAVPDGETSHPTTLAGPAFAVNRIARQEDDSLVIEFTAEPGNYYQVQYSEDAINWKSCSVPMQAGGTKVQWIDRGPPWTDSPPSSASRRFYRVHRLDD